MTQTKELPRTARGERTRRKLIDAARVVFERDGYLDARLVDITTEAGTAAGSFYTYFTSKEEVFAAVLEALQDEMLHPHVRQMVGSDDPVAVIEASNRAYLMSYQRNAQLMRLLEQVANVDRRFRELRQRRTSAFNSRNARGIRDLQVRGLADPDLDPLFAASALSSMVSRAAFSAFVLGDGWQLEELVANLTRLWANALGLSSAAPASTAPAAPPLAETQTPAPASPRSPRRKK